MPYCGARCGPSRPSSCSQQPELAELASALLEVERDMATRRDALLPELEHLVPVLADRRARAWALRTRRRLYATAHAEVDLPQPVLDAVGRAAPAVAQGVRELAISSP